MAEKDFISDHLVNMRERLRANYEQLNRPADGSPADSPHHPAPQSAVTATTALESPPSPRSSVRPGETEKIRRDLEGRIRRDCAETAAELEELDRRRRELQNFLTLLNEQVERLAERSSDDNDARELEAMRLKYFQAAGRAAAFRPAAPGPAASEPREPEKPFSRLMVEALPLGGAIVVAALIISGVLTLIFA